MTTPPRWRRYLRFFGPNPDADVDDEVRFHLDMRARDYEQRGLTHADAMRAARARFGDVVGVDAKLRKHDRTRVRAQARRDLLGDFVQDLRYALRGLRRAPAFAAVAVATLALGIGANTAVFTIVDAVVVRPLPYLRPEQLVATSGTTLGEYLRLRQLNRSFSDIGGYRETSVGLTGGVGDPERLDAANVTTSLFPLLGVAPEVGRVFGGDEDGGARSNVAIVSDALWTQRFGRDRAAVGRTVMIDGGAYTIVGVMPPTFHFPSARIQIWLPATTPTNVGALWGSGGFRFVARLRPGVTHGQAQEELRALFARIRFDNPVWDPGPDYGPGATVRPLQEKIVGSSRRLLLLLLGVVAIVLLIACANVANLLLVRGAARGREIGIRAALGGGRARLIRQLLTESVVLALVGGAVGVGVAWAGLHGLRSLLPSDMPRAAEISLDARVLAVTLCTSVAIGVLFGALPALRVSRGGVDASSRLDGRATGSGAHRRIARAIVCAEIALSLVLVIAAQLLVRTVWSLRHVDPGYRVQSIVTATVSPPTGRYPGATALNFYDAALARLRALPGVISAAAVDRVPLRVWSMSALRIEGQFEDMRHTLPTVDHMQTMSPGYLATMGIPLRAGRDFDEADRNSAPPVAIVSESFASHYWPAQNAVGKRIGYPWPSPWLTIVGVVADAKLDSLTGVSEEAVYRPLAQNPIEEMALVVRTAAPERSVAAALRGVVRQVDDGVPVSDVQTMSQVVYQSAARPRFTMLLLALFALVAVALGLIGIYGVMSYAVAQRTSEIGIRMALGATPGDALWLVLGEALTLAVSGIALGLVAAAASSRVLHGLLVGVSAMDPVTYVAMPVALAVVAMLASYVPARRATRIDATTALRGD